jgi:hypothetical protein
VKIKLLNTGAFCLRTYFFASHIQTGNGEVTITNDGATILKQISLTHPAAKMVNFHGVMCLLNFWDTLCFQML